MGASFVRSGWLEIISKRDGLFPLIWLCSLQATGGSGNPSSLNLENVGGVFVVLMAGLLVSCFVALFELLCKVYETSKREKVSV